jgi:hypothetical protein
VIEERTHHRKTQPEAAAVAADLERNAHLPLSYQRPTSQAEERYIHVERKKDAATGEVISETPIKNRKQRRTDDALERRKFKPATRRLNKRELRELMLNKYEDSLEAKPLQSTRRKKKKRATHVPAPALELDQKPAPDNSRLRDLARRATERALQAVGL